MQALVTRFIELLIMTVLLVIVCRPSANCSHSKDEQLTVVLCARKVAILWNDGPCLFPEG